MSSDVGSRARGWALPAAYAVYGPLVAVVVALCHNQLNVDGVAYLRIARYYAAGQFDLAVTGYWAPMISWCLVPVAWAGLDTVTAGHVLNAIAGAVFVWAAHRLAREWSPSGLLTHMVPACAGMLALNWQGRGVLADPLFAALLTIYWLWSYRANRTFRSRDAAVAGAMAGVCYLTKYYALPFFVLHHSLQALGAAGTFEPINSRARFRFWMCGLAGAAAVAGPWIAVLSVRYAAPTFATTHRVTHSLAGPDMPEGDYWPNYIAAKPRAGRVASWENPDELSEPWPTWSRFSSAGVVHSLRLFRRNAAEVAEQVFAADGLGVLYVTLLLTPLLALAYGHRDSRSAPWRWALIALAAYLLGFMLTFAGTRRYYWPSQGLLLVLAVVALNGMLGNASRPPNGSKRLGRLRLRDAALALAILASCAAPLVTRAPEIRSRPGLELRELARAWRGDQPAAPLASNDWHRCVVMAYFADSVCVGVPRAGDAEDVISEARRAGAESLVLFDGPLTPSGALALDSAAAALGPPARLLMSGQTVARVYSLSSDDRRDVPAAEKQLP